MTDFSEGPPSITCYMVFTPVGVFTASWSEDPEESVIYEGSEAGLDYLRCYLQDRMVTGNLGRRLFVEGLEPNDLIGFCESKDYGISVVVDFETLNDAAVEALHHKH